MITKLIISVLVIFLGVYIYYLLYSQPPLPNIEDIVWKESKNPNDDQIVPFTVNVPQQVRATLLFLVTFFFNFKSTLHLYSSTSQLHFLNTIVGINENIYNNSFKKWSPLITALPKMFLFLRNKSFVANFRRFNYKFRKVIELIMKVVIK